MYERIFYIFIDRLLYSCQKFFRLFSVLLNIRLHFLREIFIAVLVYNKFEVISALESDGSPVFRPQPKCKRFAMIVPHPVANVTSPS